MKGEGAENRDRTVQRERSEIADVSTFLRILHDVAHVTERDPSRQLK